MFICVDVCLDGELENNFWVCKTWKNVTVVYFVHIFVCVNNEKWPGVLLTSMNKEVT